MNCQISGPPAWTLSIFLAVVTLAAPVARGTAPADPWTSGGPWGGATWALLSLPDGTLVAGTDGGIFRSTDGHTFQAASSGPRTPIRSLARAVDATLYAAAINVGLFRSTDGGVTWSALSIPLGSPRSVAADPVTAGTLVLASMSGVDASSDGGLTWTRTSLASDTLSAAFTSAGHALVGTGGSGVFRTTDGGQTWAPTTGIPAGAEVSDLSVDTLGASIVWAGTNTAGLYRSSDSGASWTQATGAGPFSVTGIRARGSSVWVGQIGQLSRSTDGGTTWSVSSPFSGNPSAFAFDAVQASVMFAANDREGVHRSEDTGTTWTLANTGLNAHRIWALAADPATATVHAVADAWLFRSPDGGATWSRLPLPDSLDVVADGGARVAALTMWTGVYRSTDRGASWTETPAPPVPQSYLAWSPDGSHLFAGGAAGQVHRSGAPGGDWESFGSGLPGDATVTGLATRDGGVDVATSAGIWSSEGGAFASQWESVLFWSITAAAGHGWAAAHPNRVFHRLAGTTGFVEVAATPAGVLQVLGDPRRPATAYAGTNSGVWRSTDGGLTWGAFGLQGTTVGRLSVGANGTTLHAGLSAGGAWERTLVPPTSFYTLAPCRAVDTRDPAAPLAGPALVAGATRTFALAGTCGIPADAKSLAVNVTVVYPAAAGDLRLFPGDEIAPLASAINFRAGQVRANNANLAVSQDGTASVTVQADMAFGVVDLLLDVVGFYR